MHPKYARLVQRSKEPQNSKIQHKKLFFLKPKFLRRALGILILIVAVSWSFQYWIPSSKAFAAPWSPTHGSYGQRKQLTLVNNSGQTFESGSTYKVSIDTASLYNTGSLLSSCDDLRVVYQPSNTTAVELKRAVEYASSSAGVTTCGTSSATKVVFQLQADMSNGSNTSYYYLYYDNPQATTYSSSDALDAYNVGSKEATFVAPFNGTTTALAAGSGTPTTATGAIRYSGGKSAMSFDGKNDQVVVPIATLPLSGPYTIEAWVNLSLVTYQSLFIANNWPTGFYVDIDTSGNISYGRNSFGNASATISANTWTHLAFVYDGTNISIFKNGVRTTPVASSGTLSISSFWISNTATAGLVDEFRVSNIARYTGNFTPATTSFVTDSNTTALYHFDENGDDPRNTGKAIDDSGNGNHGTITGAKYVGGLIGVDGSSSNTSYQSNMSNQSYAAHEGVFIEEGTTNKITNPSFDHTTYNTNWSEMQFGDGADGAITVSTTKTIDTDTIATGRTYADAVNFGITASIAAGATTINVGATPNGLVAGDEILVINLRDPTNADATNYGYAVQSTATAGSANTLTDSTKSWTTNAYATMTVAITSGTGQGQQRTISSNTATVLTVSSNWTTNPDATSVYKILDPNAWTNNIASIKVGQYETRYITSIATNTLTLDRALTNAYDGTVYKIMVQRVPQYTNVTVQSGGILTVSAYNNTNAKGGVLFFRANGTVTVDSGGSIDASGKGYGGGATPTGQSPGDGGITYNGVGGRGGGTSCTSEAVSGQGGGGGSLYTNHLIGSGTTGGAGGGGGHGSGSCGVSRGGGGGGGGYGLVGIGGFGYNGLGNGVSGNGNLGGNGGKQPGGESGGGGGGGGVYGSTALTGLYLGSGGGAGGNHNGAGTGGGGGNGSGIFYTSSSQISLVGNISASGSAGGNASSDSAGGGGGSGGSIFIKGNNVALGSSLVVATQGQGGSGSLYGGSGGVGRIRVESPSISGTTSPAASTSSTIGSLTATENSSAPYVKFGSKSTKLVSTATASYTIGINPAAASSHTLSAYVYDGTSGNVGGTISASIAKLVFEGTPVATGYTDMGGGWWRLTYTGTTTNATNQYGVQVLSGKTIYVDGVQLEEKAYATTYTDGTEGTGYAWTGTANESTSTRTAGSLEYSTTNNILSSGTASFWYKNHTGSVNFSSTAIISTGVNDYWNSGSFFVENTNNNLITYCVNGQCITGGTSWAQTKWLNITLIWTTNDLRAYVNGNLDASSTTFTVGGINSPLVLGTYKSRSGYLTSSHFSDFRIFNTALTSTEVADLYYSGLGSHSSLAPVATERYTDGEPPVLAWHLNDPSTGSGQAAYDSTIYRNDGTISGASWSNETYESYGTNKSLSFDGSNDYVSRTYQNDTELAPALQSFSVGGWFKHPSTVSGTDTLISRYSSTGSGGGYKVYMNTSGYLCFGVDDDSTWGPDDSACTTVSYADSNWHHIIAIKGTTTIAVYIDGVQKASTALTATNSLNGSTPTLYVGIDSDGTSNPWDGFIDEVRVYNSSRSEEQINQEYIAKGTNKGVSAQFGSGGPAVTLSQGLVGHWKMDEASWNGTAGEVLDASGNGNNGVRSGDATTAAGKFGNGGTFDGTGDYVSAGNPNISVNATISLWVKPDGNLGYLSQGLFDTKPWSGGAMRIYSYGGGSLAYELGASGCSSVAIGDWTGQWHHIVLVLSQSNIESLFIDSTIKSTCTNNINASSSTFQIGRFNNGSHFDGTVDDVRIYNRALSPAEVRALYEYAPGPVAHYTFDEGSGQSAYDKSGNNNTGTLGANSSVGSDDPTWTNGKYGKALSFDGSDDGAFIPYSISLAPAYEITLEAWVKPNSVTGGDIIWGFAGRRAGSGNDMGVLNGKVRLEYHYSGTEVTINSISSIQTNVWTHISATLKSGEQKIYINGQLDKSDTQGIYLTGTEGTFIGYGWLNAAYKYFDGSLDDVRIYNYARSQKQIVMDMNAGHPAVGSPVGSAVAHYKFDEGQGTTARNYGSGGSTLNGTLTNMSSPATSTSGWTNDGKFSKALNFDRSNDYVIAGSTINLSSALTFSTWAKTSINDAGAMPLVTNLNGGVRSGPLFAMLNGKFIFHNGSAWCATSNLTYSDNNWHNAILVIDGNTQKIYVDGKQDGSSTCTYNQNSTDRLLIGSQYNNNVPANSWFAGSIDEVKIYNYALSEDEVKLEYNAGKAIVMGNLGTTTDGKTASNAQSRAYCPPGNVEGNCAAGQNPAPVAEWNFDSGSGQSALDTSGNNNTGQLGSSAGVDTTDPTWTNGKVGKGLSFDGSDDYVDIPDSSLFTFTSDFTISSWINPTVVDKSNQGIFGTFNGGGIALTTSVGTNGHIGLWTQCNPSIWNDSGASLTSKTWQYITVNRTSGLIKIYVNGREIYQVSANCTIDGGNLNIGRWYTEYSQFGGLIDQVRIYSYARTPAQIAWDYNGGAPVAWYRFDECSGTVANNAAPVFQGDAGNDGTITIGASGTQTSAGTCSSGNSAHAWNNGTTGKLSSSMSFDGTDDYVDIGNNSATNITGTFSIAGWIYWTGTTFNYNPLVARWNGAGNIGYGLNINPSSKVRFDVYGSSGTGQFMTGSTTILPNTWYYIVGTIDDSKKARIYVNGLLDSGPVTFTAYSGDPGTNTRIGDDSSSVNRKWKGQIDDVRIYNYALSDAQVKLLYNNGAVSFK